ncbi:MAG TPA: nucleotidyltransferase family protein [Hyphomicrobiaceae bacterium]|jgi:molybdenum cofactor cytidylyltransferase|nr:nucleotidyltransferase family protein [Hyphomicrobiaceae bacterium]
MRALGAVVLGAGMSERFGTENKLLADIGGDPLIRNVVREVIGSGIADVVVVTGWDETRIATAIEDLPARCAHNENWRSGMGTSVAAGIAALHGDIEGAFIVPGDMPRLTSILLVRLASAFDESGRRKVVFPVTAGGDQRNPVLWPRRYFPLLTSLRGPQGGKQLLQRLAELCVAVRAEDDRQLLDVDEIDDLIAARQTRN